MFSKSTLSSSSLNSAPVIHESQKLSNQIASINNYEKCCKNLKAEFKKLNRFLFDISCDEKQLTNDLTNFPVVNDTDELYLTIEKFIQYLNKISKNREDLTINVNRTIIEPLQKFKIAFNEMKSAIKQYEHLISENAKYSQKVAKYKNSERTSNNIVKLHEYEKMLKQIQIDCEAWRNELERELPLFLNKRIDYFQPSLTAFISSEILYSGNNFDALNELGDIVEQVSEYEIQDRQQKIFDSIDGLSIVSS